MQISAVMITHNADRRLAQVLESLSWCNEIVIVDSGSTDQTVELAQRYGARIHQRPFESFSTQKQFSVDLAQNDWVLVIDSDEVVSEELKASILASTSDLVMAYEVPRVLYFLGARISHSGGVDYPLRLFNRKFARFNSKAVHEGVEVLESAPQLLKVGRLEGFLEHYSYDSLKEYIKKFHRYTSLAAGEAQGRYGRAILVFKILTSFPATFVKLYFFKLGFLDGVNGLLWCGLSALSPVVKYSKMFAFKKSSGCCG